jgi:hypothetical protein
MTISLLTNMAHSVPLLSGWRTTIDELPGYDVTHWCLLTKPNSTLINNVNPGTKVPQFFFFLLSLFFDSEDRDIFLRNVSLLSPDYTEL